MSSEEKEKPALIPELLRVIVRGSLTPFGVKETLRFLNSTKRIDTVANLFVLNGIIFGGFLAIWEWAALPFLDHFFGWFLGATEETKVGREIASKLFTYFFLGPMLVLMYILNMIWYNEIAEDAFKKRKLKEKRGVSNSIRDVVYRVLLIIILTIQSWASRNLLPMYIGYPIEFLQSSWTIAFYCFDYRWSLAGLTLDERLRKFESYWPFMLGFGAPLAALALWLPDYWGYVVYDLFFPMSMILAIETDPIQHRRGWSHLRVFRVSQFFTLWLIRGIEKLIRCIGKLKST